MHTDDLIIDHSTTRKAIERVAELLPHLDREPTTAFVVKSINPVDAGTFMVATQEEEILRVLDLVREQQTYNFERLFPPVDVISKE